MQLLAALILSTVVVAPAETGFALRVDPGEVGLAVGQSAGASVRTTAGDAPERITLSATGLPAGVTAAFTPSTLDTGQDAAITLRAAPDAQPGVYQVRVVGTGTTSASGGFTLTLRPDDPPVGFAIGASPVTAEAGRQATTTVWSSGQGGQITLAASGLPSGVSAAFQPNPIAIGSTSTLTFTAAPTATTGTSTVVLTGTDAMGRPARAEILFTVTAPALRVTATPDGATTRRGGLTATTVAATEPAVFSATGVPAGTTVHWHQRGTTATAYFFTTFQTPLGAHPVTIKATSADGRSATTTFTLTVTRW